MFASMEYLLAGLPVVSTKSKGGRDFFFDERFVEIVDDNTHSVSKGVQKIIQKNIDPEIIRSETLQKVNKQRKKFYQLIEKIVTDNKNSSIEPFSSFYNRVWNNKDGIESLPVVL